MGWHPTFLQCYVNTMHVIMREDGPLPIPWRHYLAIMAASRYRCEYLICLEKFYFLSNGGDRDWLKGTSSTPPKLQALLQLNALLAHQPWLITPEHIAALVSRKGPNSWSVSELVHAFVILSSFHSMCGFVYGMGLAPEADLTDLTTHQRSRTKPKILTLYENIFDTVSERKDERKEDRRQHEHLFKLLSTSLGEDETDQHRKLTANANIFGLAGELPPSPPSHSSGCASPNSAGPTGQSAVAAAKLTYEAIVSGLKGCKKDDSGLFLTVDGMDQKFVSMTYVPFDVNSKTYKTFNLHDYNWKEQGYSMVNRFCNNLGFILDTELDGIYNLTYNMLATAEKVDTSPFRQAIWYYTLRLYGMCHDDYNYHRIPVFLSQSVRTYVKKVACDPESLTFADYELKGYSFTHPERAHIALLAAEAHRQASLLYGLYALNKYITQS